MKIPEHRKTVLWRYFVRYLALTIISLVFVMPLVFMAVSSLKPDLQLLRDTSSLKAFIPYGEISLNNYFEAFHRVPILRFLLNSMLITSTTVILGIGINSMAAFSFVFLRWKGRNLILSIIIATYIVPFESITIPLLLLVNQLPSFGANTGWLNSYHVQIIPLLAYSFQIFLFHQFFKEIPADLVEASVIDGAGWFRIYRTIILPLSGPVIATAAILRSLDMWNQYMWPLLVVQSEQYRPVMVGLQYFFQLDIAWGEIMAYLTTITVPIIILYLCLQRAFIESIASTGVKG